MGFSSWLHGGGIDTHIWILWKPPIVIEPLWISEQSITIQLQIPLSEPIVATLVYANTLKRIRERLWEHVDQDTRSAPVLIRLLIHCLLQAILT